MNWQAANLFVGSVAFAIGAGALASALGNWEATFRLPKVQWLDRRLGRGGARGVLAGLGIALMGLGVAIALGFAPNASRTTAAAARALPPVQLREAGGSVA